MKVKTKDLTGAQLDWAVATCEGETYSATIQYNRIGMEFPATLYSEDYSLAGPIIEREGITIIRCDDDWGVDAKGFTTNQRIPVWCATTGQHSWDETTEHQQHAPMYQIYTSDVVYGPTPLIAAMRCYVASKLRRGEIDVPDELAEQA